MANIAAYSRHKMLEEIRSPLFTNYGDGATPLVYTPDEQRVKFMNNLQAMDGMPSGFAITTGATTTFLQHHRTSAITGVLEFTLTNFAIGTSADGASLGFGAEVITVPTSTLVRGGTLNGVMTLADDGQTTAIQVGIGQTVASGAVSNLDGTPDFESIMPGTPTTAFTDAGTTSTANIRGPQGGVGGSGTLHLTGSSGTSVFLNVAGAWDAGLDAAAALTFTGTMTLEYRLV